MYRGEFEEAERVSHGLPNFYNTQPGGWSYDIETIPAELRDTLGQINASVEGLFKPEHGWRTVALRGYSSPPFDRLDFVLRTGNQQKTKVSGWKRLMEDPRPIPLEEELKPELAEAAEKAGNKVPVLELGSIPLGPFPTIDQIRDAKVSGYVVSVATARFFAFCPATRANISEEGVLLYPNPVKSLYVADVPSRMIVKAFILNLQHAPEMYEAHMEDIRNQLGSRRIALSETLAEIQQLTRAGENQAILYDTVVKQIAKRPNPLHP